MWKDARVQCWVLQKARRESRASLTWLFSGEGVTHFGIAHYPHYTKAEGAFSLVSLMAQVNCTTEFQIVSNFSSSAGTIGGSQVMQERDQCDSSSENVASFIGCRWVLGEIPHLDLWEASLLPVIYSCYAFWQHRKKPVTINRYHLYCGKGILWRADTHNLVPTGWTFGLIFAF